MALPLQSLVVHNLRDGLPSEPRARPQRNTAVHTKRTSASSSQSNTSLSTVPRATMIIDLCVCDLTTSPLLRVCTVPGAIRVAVKGTIGRKTTLGAVN